MTLNALRTSRKLTAREVSRRMGMSHPNVLRLERTGSAPLRTLQAYADALGLTLDKVVEGCQETMASRPSECSPVA